MKSLREEIERIEDRVRGLEESVLALKMWQEHHDSITHDKEGVFKTIREKPGSRIGSGKRTIDALKKSRWNEDDG